MPRTASLWRGLTVPGVEIPWGSPSLLLAAIACGGTIAIRIAAAPSTRGDLFRPLHQTR